jgi:hypothetical protein
MASFINVFLRTPKPLEALVSDVETMLGIHLVPRPDDFGALYGAAFMGMDVAVYEAIGYEADRNMDFPSYQVEIDMGPLTGEPRHDESVRRAALSLARRLRHEGGYPVMVTEDLQRVLECLEAELKSEKTGEKGMGTGRRRRDC